MISYRILESVEELRQVEALEVAVWSLANAMDAVPMYLLRPVSHYGGLVQGAFDDDQLVGMSIALPLRVEQKWVLWSHATGLLPTHRSLGIGETLKLLQRTWALENGYDEIRWTFDPLQAGNANFNLNRLGTVALNYTPNYYGPMEDAINQGLPSDRVEACWYLNRPTYSYGEELDMLPILLHCSEHQQPVVDQAVLVANPPIMTAQIPARHPGEQALAWIEALRQTMAVAFDHGYRAVHFQKFADSGTYVLARE
jgi:predicted GNAT superfamily acetyltransferase